MPESIAIADAVALGLELAPHEAVAIVQEVIAGDPAATVLIPPLGPPSLYNVFIDRDGAVRCRGCATTPAVSEIGVLLDSLLLHRGRLPIPGALRYVVARAQLEVDAPPIDSLHQLSETLDRFEQGDRPTVLGLLAARALAPQAMVAAVVERRRTPPSATELRRRLRDADRAAYEARLTPEPPVRPTSTVVLEQRERPSRLAMSSAAAAVVAIAFLAGYETISHRGAIAADVVPQPDPLWASTRTAGVGELPASVVPALDDVSRTFAAARPRATHAIARADELDAQPSFASNRSALFGERDGGDGLAVMTIAGDRGQNYHVHPSPDGTRIAFDSNRDGERGVYVATRDGSGVRRVTGAGFAALPSWSPDGQRLVFVRAEPDRPQVWNLWLMTLESGATRRLTNHRDGQTWGASWFRDGRRIGYAHGDEIVVLDFDGGDSHVYRSPIAGRSVRSPAVSPDGRHVIFQVERSGAWVLDLDDGSMRCALTDPTAEEFAWSADSRRVAFHSRRDGEWGLWIMAPS